MSKHDELTICKRCGSDACYKQEVSEEITNYQCMGCGFQTNSLLTKGSKFYNEQVEVLPELYKDILFQDEDGLIWMPSSTNIPDKGLDMKTMKKYPEKDYMEALDYIGVFNKPEDEN